MAIDLLDSIRNSDDAYVLVALIPWAWTCTEDGHAVRKLLWDESPIESATEADGASSVPCRRFVSHRHSQYFLNKFFCGDYPGSTVRIPTEGSGIMAIVLQAMLPLLPGTLVEVMPCEVPRNEAIKGPRVDKAFQSRNQVEDKEAPQMDPELMQIVEVLKRTVGGVVAGAGIDEDSALDVVADLCSGRGIRFFNVPKVKFTLHLFAHLACKSCRSNRRVQHYRSAMQSSHLRSPAR